MHQTIKILPIESKKLFLFNYILTLFNYHYIYSKVIEKLNDYS